MFSKAIREVFKLKAERMYDRHQKRSLDYVVRLRRGEYSLYLVYDTFISCIEVLTGKTEQIKGFIPKIRDLYLSIRYGKRTTKLGDVVPDIEYYLIDDQVKIRKYNGVQGSWKQIDGKLVKVSGDTEAVPYFIPWKECNQGYYDEELGTRIYSKGQYRAEMKSQGLVPFEKNIYGKSRETMREERTQVIIDKGRKRAEIAFNEGLKKVGAV